MTAAVTLAALTSACASSTVIRSEPSGAKLYLNGEPVGRTPYTMTDTKIVGSTTTVHMELDGYESVDGVISRNEEFDVGACIGGVFLLVPFLWIMRYKPVHTFELRPLNGSGYPPPAWPSAPPAGWQPGAVPQGPPPAAAPQAPPPGAWAPPPQSAPAPRTP
ncbi:MAG: PEGA domain-containing protein [Myxococcales bacterium]|nr:PEGA domain-containing protein [Myxococcales bacterium]